MPHFVTTVTTVALALSRRFVRDRGPANASEESERFEHGVVVTVIAFATLSALLWALVRVPGAGGPDEASHVALIERMRDAGGIPLFQGFEPGKFSGSPGRVINAHELTPNLSALGLAGLASVFRLNDPAATTLLGRLYAVCLFPLTLALAYRTLCILLPGRPVERVVGLTTIATIPQFMLTHSSVTNDTPTIAAASLGIYAVARGWKEGFRKSDALLLGAALGLVGLHKASGWVAMPMAAGLIAWRLRREVPRMLGALGIVALIVLAVAGWWYVRMLIIYGDPIGTATTQAAIEATGTAVATPRDQGLSPWEYARTSGWLEKVFRSFWAGYGVRKMTVPDAAYLAFLAMLVVGMAGLIGAAAGARGAKTKDGPVWLAFGLVVVVQWVLNFWTSWTLDGAAFHGRYAYPMIVPFAALLAVGLGRAVVGLSRSRFPLAMMVPLMVAGNMAYFVHVVVPDVVGL